MLLFRYSLSRGNLALNTLERIFHISKSCLNLPVKKRLEHPGSSHSNTLGPVVLDDLSGETVWVIDLKTKRQIFGKRRQAVGGPLEGKPKGMSSLPPVSQSGSNGDDRHVMFYHTGSSALVKELIHCNNIKAVIDLAPGAGLWAIECLKERIPYAGLCMNKKHLDGLMAHLVDRVIALFKDS